MCVLGWCAGVWVFLTRRLGVLHLWGPRQEVQLNLLGPEESYSGEGCPTLIIIGLKLHHEYWPGRQKLEAKSHLC